MPLWFFASKRKQKKILHIYVYNFLKSFIKFFLKKTKAIRIFLGYYYCDKNILYYLIESFFAQSSISDRILSYNKNFQVDKSSFAV